MLAWKIETYLLVLGIGLRCSQAEVGKREFQYSCDCDTFWKLDLVCRWNAAYRLFLDRADGTRLCRRRSMLLL